jgi:hypothetical protein
MLNTVGGSTMTAATGNIRQPGLRIRTAAFAMTATFAVGLLAGLVVPQVRLPSGTAPASAAGASDAARVQAYQEYRRGERDLFATERAAEGAWLVYRAGERGDRANP